MTGLLTQRVVTIAALVLAVALAIPAIRHWREQPPPPPAPPEPLQSSWSPPDTAALGGGGDYPFGLAIAPDGRELVYPASRAGVVSLWRQDLRSGDTRALPGTEGAVAPFWSSDAGRIGFFAGGRLRAFDVSRGEISDLADAPAPRGGTWNASGDVVFAPSARGPLLRRDASGTIRPLTTVTPNTGETAHAWPQFLPDGKHLIFLVIADDRAQSGIWLASLDDPSTRKRLLASDTQALAVDHTLIYVADLSLMAQEFDPETFALRGRARAIGLRAGRGPLNQLFATASADVLIFGPPGTTLRELRWLSRTGAAEWSSQPLDAWDVRVAPDGRRFVVTQVDPQLRTLDVMIRTATQPAPTRVSLSTDADESAAWSPDGLRVAWVSQRRKLLMRGAGAVLPEQVIAAFDTPLQVWDWSRDGRVLLIGRRSAATGDDLWLQPPVEDATARPYSTAAFNQIYGAIAPDGTRIAYASDESGQFDIYVDAFPTPAARLRVTTAGGTEPRWSADGRELYFRRGSEVHAAAISGAEVRSTTRLFDAGAPIRSYDVSRDGRFLVNVPAAGARAAAATLIAHWQTLPH